MYMNCYLVQILELKFFLNLLTLYRHGILRSNDGRPRQGVDGKGRWSRSDHNLFISIR